MNWNAGPKSVRFSRTRGQPPIPRPRGRLPFSATRAFPTPRFAGNAGRIHRKRRPDRDADPGARAPLAILPPLPRPPTAYSRSRTGRPHRREDVANRKRAFPSRIAARPPLPPPGPTGTGTLENPLGRRRPVTPPSRRSSMGKASGPHRRARTGRTPSRSLPPRPARPGRRFPGAAPVFGRGTLSQSRTRSGPEIPGRGTAAGCFADANPGRPPETLGKTPVAYPLLLPSSRNRRPVRATPRRGPADADTASLDRTRTKATTTPRRSHNGS